MRSERGVRGSVRSLADRGHTQSRVTEGIDMLRRLGIRAKVMAVLAVPMIVLLMAGAYISYGAVQNYRTASAAQSVVDVLEAYKPLSSAMEAERVVSLTGGSKEEVAAARQQTDAALASVREVTSGL